MARVPYVDERVERQVFAPIERPRLIARLAAAGSFPITLLVAPAGYGKSVLLRQYLAALSKPWVRFAVRPEHGTLLSFVRGFAEALRDVATHATTALAGAYERNQMSRKPGAALASWMKAHLATFSGVVAFDDLHFAVSEPETAQFVASLMEQTKTHITWIISSRALTGLPSGTWLAYHDSDLVIDDSDLRFTIEEVRAEADGLNLSVSDQELNELLNLTNGWPAAISFALRTSIRSNDLRKVSAATREMMNQLLAEHVYADLTNEERQLLEVAVTLPLVDIGVLELAGFDRALQIVEGLRQRTGFIHEESPKIYHCHELFGDFLRRQSALGGKRSQQLAAERAARALEVAGDIEHAIAAYVAADSPANILRLLEARGFDLLERAQSDVVGQSIEALDESTYRDNATVLALRGALQATAGRFARAESLCRRALARAGENRDLLATTTMRLATLMANQSEDVSELLAGLRNDPNQNPIHRAEAASLIAAQQAVWRTPSAAEAAERAEKMLLEVDSEAVRAKVLHRIGIAYHHLGLAGKAFEVLTQSAELAAGMHLFGLASRANAVLSNLVLHEHDDVAGQLSYARVAADDATKAGDAFALQTALLQMLSAEMRLGNVEGSVSIEHRLEAAYPGRLTSRYLAIFRAERMAWEGRFAEAWQLLARSWREMTFSFDRTCAGAEYALFLALDGQREESVMATKKVLELLDPEHVTGLYRIRSIAVTQTLCALTEAVNGRTTYAERILGRVIAPKDSVIRLVIAGVRGLAFGIEHDEKALAARETVIEQLGVRTYGDVSRLLGAVASFRGHEPREGSRRTRLTRSEVEVLRLLQEGLVPKEIALQRSRSIYTVRVHIANAIAKLGCHGHAEAIRAARRLGLI